MGSRSMPQPSKRKRGRPVFIDYEEILGTDVKFALDRGRRLLFTADHPMLAFGVYVQPDGEVQLTPGYGVHEVTAVLRQPAGSDAIVSFAEGDRDSAVESAVKKAVMAGTERLLRNHAAKFSSALLTVADDVALEQMSYIAHIEEKLAAIGDSDWRQADFLKEQIERAERDAASVDQEAYEHSWLHASRPGYVVVCDGQLVDRGEERHGRDSGAGWVQRHVFVHLYRARSFARERVSGDEVRVERIRVFEGQPWTVIPEGFARPEWSLERPVLTGSLISP